MNDKQLEMVKNIVNYLKLHESKLRGTIHQNSYKIDFFRLFSDAYVGGYILHSDAFADKIVQSFPDHLQPDGSLDPEMSDLLISFCDMWNEWIYAWETGLMNSLIYLKE